MARPFLVASVDVEGLEMKTIDQARIENPGGQHRMQMKAVQNVNKVLCQEYNSLDTN